jgi:hypothetical protein
MHNVLGGEDNLLVNLKRAMEERPYLRGYFNFGNDSWVYFRAEGG